MMNKEELSQIFEDYDFYSECAYAKNDRSWSDIIHYPTHRELILSYDAAPNYFDFIRFMRAFCIQNTVFYVPMTPDKKYYKYYEYESGPIPLYSTKEEAKLAYKKYRMPSVEYCEEKTLMELLENAEKATEFVINPATECKFVKQSYYTDCLELAENIDEKHIWEILEKRKPKGDWL